MDPEPKFEFDNNLHIILENYHLTVADAISDISKLKIAFSLLSGKSEQLNGLKITDTFCNLYLHNYRRFSNSINNVHRQSRALNCAWRDELQDTPTRRFCIHCQKPLVCKLPMCTRCNVDAFTGVLCGHEVKCACKFEKPTQSCGANCPSCTNGY
jgi:hypothetical protein